MLNKNFPPLKSSTNVRAEWWSVTKSGAMPKLLNCRSNADIRSKLVEESSLPTDFRRYSEIKLLICLKTRVPRWFPEERFLFFFCSSRKRFFAFRFTSMIWVSIGGIFRCVFSQTTIVSFGFLAKRVDCRQIKSVAVKIFELKREKNSVSSVENSRFQI